MNMRTKRIGLLLLAVLLLAVLLQIMTPHISSTVAINPRPGSLLKESIDKRIYNITSSYKNVPYHIKDSVSRCAAQKHVLFPLYVYVFELSFPFLFSWHSLIASKTCACLGDEESFRLPLSNYLYPRVWAHDLGVSFLESQPDPEKTKQHRAEEYNKYQNRWQTHKDKQTLHLSIVLKYPSIGLKSLFNKSFTLHHLD